MHSIKNVLRGNLMIFTIGDIVRQFSLFITFPYFSFYISSLGGNNVAIGLVNSSYFFASFFIYPIAGFLADRYNRVKIIVICGYLFAAISLIFMLASDWKILALGRFFTGLVVFQFPAMTSLLADSLPPDKIGIGYSLWIAIPSIIGIISPYVGGYLITILGVKKAMRTLYGLTSITSLVITTINLKFLKETREENYFEVSDKGLFRIFSETYKEFYQVLKILPRSLKAFMLILILSFFVNNIATPFWAVYSVREIGLSELQWGIALLVATIVNIIFLIPAGIIVDRFGVVKILCIASSLTIIPLFLFPYGHNLTETTLIIIVINIANAFLTSAAPSFMVNSTPPGKRGRIMAALGQGLLLINLRGGTGGPGMGMLLTIPSIIGSVLGGFIYSNNPTFPWILFALLMMVNTLLCVILLFNGNKKSSLLPN